MTTATIDPINQRILDSYTHWKENKDKPFNERVASRNYIDEAKNLKDRQGNYRYPDLHDEYFDELKARAEQQATQVESYSVEDLQTKLNTESLLK
jgi:hypothetical protein